MATTNNNTSTSKRYTYAQFATDVLALLEGQKSMSELPIKAMCAKATDLINAQATKAAYNASHPRKNAAKGASTDTKARAEQIAAVLDGTPKTAADINAELGTDFTALQVANACKYIEGCKSCKVIRSTVNAKGLKADKEYTAYTVE